MHTCVVEGQKKNDAFNCIKIKDFFISLSSTLRARSMNLIKDLDPTHISHQQKPKSTHIIDLNLNKVPHFTLILPSLMFSNLLKPCLFII